MTRWTSRLLFLLLAAGLLGSSLAAPAAADAPLALEAKIPLGEVRGRIDHLAVDLGRKQLFVAELGNGSLGVVDLAAARVFRRLGGLAEPQGVAFDPATDTVFVATGGDGALHRFEGDDLAPLEPVPLGEDADNVRLDSRAGRVVVGYGGGALALIGVASGEVQGRVRLPGHPESFQLERDGPRAFVNVPEARQIAVVDRSAGRGVARWGLPDARANFPMALDEAGGRLLVAYREPALLAVFDTRSGGLVAQLPVVGDADDVFLDTKRRRVYVSGGEGFLDVLQQRGDTYERQAHIPTAPGARTALFVPELDRLFLAVRATAQGPAAIWVFRPEP